MEKPFAYGGQALIEGVMMRGKDTYAMAVRKPDGSIALEKKPVPHWLTKWKITQLPFIRGFFNLIDMMILGFSAISFSAAQAGETEEESLSSWEITLTMLVAVVIGTVLFIAIPVYGGSFMLDYFKSFATENTAQFARSVTEGLLRVIIFVSYIWAIGRMEEIKRVFAYHGAEHKTINALEAGQELTPEKVEKFSTIHPRCGTSFIVIVMLLMVIVFTFVGRTGILLRMLIKIVMMPVIAGISYELLKLSAKYGRNPLVRILIAPGLWIQRLTTNEPDRGMLEVAIKALKAVF